MYHQPLQFGNRTAPILTSEASITDISCNDFLNAYASCMDSGDIYAGFPQQLLFNYLDKNIREFRCVCFNYSIIFLLSIHCLYIFSF